MTDTQRALLLVALIAAVIAVLMIGAHKSRIEPAPQPDPVKWHEIPVDTCLDRCVTL